MLTLGDRLFTSGRCRFLDSDGIRDEPKIYTRIIPGDWETPILAQLDTGAAWSVLDTEIVPPRSSTSRLLIVSPSPVPPNRRVVELSACVNGEKSVSIWSSAIPIPVSITSICSFGSSPGLFNRRVMIRTEPVSVNLMALPTMLGYKGDPIPSHSFEYLSRYRRLSRTGTAGYPQRNSPHNRLARSTLS